MYKIIKIYNKVINLFGLQKARFGSPKSAE